MKYNSAYPIIAACLLISAGMPAYADDFNDERKKLLEEFESFRRETIDEFESYRRQINEEYAKALENPWENIKVTPAEKRPVEPEPEPPVWDDRDPEPRRDNPLPIINVVEPPAPLPRPEPVKPINPSPRPPKRLKDFKFYGTQVGLSAPEWDGFSLYGSDEASVANAWKWLGDRSSDSFISDLLKQRSNLALPDWGYLKLVDQALTQFAPSGSNAHTAMMGYVLAHSGYKIRLCRKDDSTLSLFLATPGIIYDHPSLIIDGSKFSSYRPSPSSTLYVSRVSYPGERPMSLEIPNVPRFDYVAGNQRNVKVKNHPEISLDVTVNKNLIDFFNDYPAGTLDNNFISRWVILARTPASNEIKEQLYPKLRPYLQGMNQKEAVNLLLKVAQSFPYGFDDEIWGDDRAFWMEESWHYPKSDCEDHAIHFVKLVKDLVGIDVALIYHPGHLYAAVCPTDGSLEGDYIMHGGKKYIVCDPTYFYAPAGRTSSNMDNSQATLIPVN